MGIAPSSAQGAAKALAAPIVGMVPSPDDGGYFMVGADGGVFAFGDAKFAGSCPGIGGCLGSAVALMPDATGNGYWLVTSAGDVYTFADARSYGAPGARSVPVTAAVRTPDGDGYWILFANGQVDGHGAAASVVGSLPSGAAGGPTRPLPFSPPTTGVASRWQLQTARSSRSAMPRTRAAWSAST
jgi:hypothetical protein